MRASARLNAPSAPIAREPSWAGAAPTAGANWWPARGAPQKSWRASPHRPNAYTNHKAALPPRIDRPGHAVTSHESHVSPFHFFCRRAGAASADAGCLHHGAPSTDAAARRTHVHHGASLGVSRCVAVATAIAAAVTRPVGPGHHAAATAPAAAQAHPGCATPAASADLAAGLPGQARVLHGGGLLRPHEHPARQRRLRALRAQRRPDRQGRWSLPGTLAVHEPDAAGVGARALRVFFVNCDLTRIFDPNFSFPEFS